MTCEGRRVSSKRKKFWAQSSKTTVVSILLLAGLGLNCFAAVDEPYCNDDLRRRIIRGDKKKAQRLYATIRGKFPSWDKDFHEEEFTYLGSLKNGTEVAFLVTIWGGSCRATTRLLLFKGGKYFGCLNGIDTPMDSTQIKVSGNKIIFPAERFSDGGAIDLSNGIPPESDFMPADRQ